MKILNTLILGGVLTASALVTSCGGSDSTAAAPAAPVTPTPSKATISTANYKELALAATTGTKRAASGSSSATTGFASLAGGFLKTSNSVVHKALGSPLQSTDFTEFLCPDGGSAIVEGLDTIDPTSTSFTFSITYTACLDFDTTFNGLISMTSAADGSFSATYTNFTITVGSESETINGSISCNAIGVCTENFTGDFDSRTYETEEFDITGDDISGYNGSGTVIDPDFGEITIVVSNVTFTCAPDEQPGSGTITITGDGESATLTFNDCTSFTFTYEGVPETFNWADI